MGPGIGCSARPITSSAASGVAAASAARQSSVAASGGEPAVRGRPTSWWMAVTLTASSIASRSDGEVEQQPELRAERRDRHPVVGAESVEEFADVLAHAHVPDQAGAVPAELVEEDEKAARRRGVAWGSLASGEQRLGDRLAVVGGADPRRGLERRRLVADRDREVGTRDR